MSRIGRKPIVVPSGVEIKIGDDSVSVKGKNGELKFAPILTALKRNNYAGVIAVEPFDYSPDGPGVAAFSAGYLRGLREALDRPTTWADQQ